MKNKADYSKYECPYSHLEKESGHELTGPEGHQDVYGLWCACGFRGPVFYLDPDELGLKLKNNTKVKITDVVDGKADSPLPIEVIPNYMGINLCSVDSIEWIEHEDTQIEKLTINFIPNMEKEPNETYGGDK